MIELNSKELIVPGFSENLFVSVIDSMMQEEDHVLGDLIVNFMDDEGLLKFNKELLNHDYFTDIITIDQKVGNIVSGELLVSVERITDNSKDLNVDVLHEFYRVLFHGVLHIIGYNDKTEEEAKVIRERENFYLSKLSF